LGKSNLHHQPDDSNHRKEFSLNQPDEHGQSNLDQPDESNLNELGQSNLDQSEESYQPNQSNVGKDSLTDQTLSEESIFTRKEVNANKRKASFGTCQSLKKRKENIPNEALNEETVGTSKGSEEFLAHEDSHSQELTGASKKPLERLAETPTHQEKAGKSGCRKEKVSKAPKGPSEKVRMISSGSKWYDGCVYECPECLCAVHDHNKLRDHFV
jgi:hypothetical protein